MQSRRRLGQLEPGRVGRVGQQDRGPAGVGHDAEARTRGSRLGREQCGDVQQLAEAVGANHAGLVEQRVDGRIRCRHECARMRAGCTRPGMRAARLDRDDRLVASDAPRDTREPPGVTERLQIQRDHVRAVVLLPPLEQVVARDVSAIADRYEAREPDAVPAALLERGDADPAALGEQRDPTAIRSRLRKRGVQARTRYAQAVGSDHAHAGGTAERGEPAPAKRSIVVLEAGRDHEQGRHSVLGALTCHGLDGICGHSDHGKLDRCIEL